MNSTAKELLARHRSSNVEQTSSIWSEDGRFESFDLNGDRYVIDWNEVDPPHGDSEPAIPHEVVMREMDLLLEELMATRK